MGGGEGTGGGNHRNPQTPQKHPERICKKRPNRYKEGAKGDVEGGGPKRETHKRPCASGRKSIRNNGGGGGDTNKGKKQSKKLGGTTKEAGGPCRKEKSWGVFFGREHELLTQNRLQESPGGTGSGGGGGRKTGNFSQKKKNNNAGKIREMHAEKSLKIGRQKGGKNDCKTPGLGNISAARDGQRKNGGDWRNKGPTRLPRRNPNPAGER